MHNWAQTVAYGAERVVRPQDLDELCAVVARSPRVKALGSRHSFNHGADTTGVQVSLDALPADLRVDAESRLVTCPAGLTHSQVSLALDRHGLALPNLASLPHISVGGAIQTGTHGSGRRNAALSADVVALGIVDAQGRPREVTRDDPDFAAVVVGLGALGVVHEVTLRCVPSFDVAQTVHEHLPWDAVLEDLDAVLGSAYSVSLFTTYAGPTVAQVWVKRRPSDPDPLDLTTLGATAATTTVHMLPGTPHDNVTAQLGEAGPSHERLPHFRHEFQPGRGDEIQSEYLLDVARGVEAIQALRGLADVVAPLLHMAEIRRVAPDDAWLSPASGRDSVALHFTWRRLPAEVADVVTEVERVLLPLGARSHWGKVFACDHDALAAAYPRLRDFTEVVRRWDPSGRFHNDWLERVLGTAPGHQPRASHSSR